MRQAVQEQISALIDGELDRKGVDDLVALAAADPEVGSQVGRYALMSEVMLRQPLPRLNHDLADRVAAALDNEPRLAPGSGPPLRDSRRRRRAHWQRRWLSPVSGLALAASVATLAVLVWPMLGSDEAGVELATGPALPAVEPVAALMQGPWLGSPDGLIPTGGAGGASMPTSVHWDRLDPRVQQHLQGYALFHGSEAAGQQLPVIPPTIRLTRQDVDAP
jgi:sigma-E factor negative regulatory protein RseA